MGLFSKDRPPKPAVQPAPATVERTRPPEGEWPAANAAPAAPAPVIEEKPEPGEGREFPCPGCGAKLEYSPTGGRLECTHCGNVVQIPQSTEEVEELSFQKYFEAGSVAEEVLHGVVGETRCPGCGAMVELSAEVARDKCPFCASDLTNPVESAKPMMRPSGVLPFLIEAAKARALVGEWLKSRWFAPGGFKRLDTAKRLNGIYVPHWTYDAMTYSFFVGQRGDAYYVTVGSGKNQRRERRIRWTTVSGHIHHFFDDVLICATKTLPDEHLSALEPWDLKSAAAYDPAFLAGFQTERYQISARESFDAARAEMDDAIRGMVRRRIGGDEQRITSVRTQVEGVTFKLLLLPVWLTAFRYKEKTFRVLINARTGEVRGERPWSAVKISFTVLVVLAILIPIIAAIAGNAR